jgi:flagellar hook protein FlgE
MWYDPSRSKERPNVDLSIAASGLNAAIRQQELVANNIANAQTPGYRALRAASQANPTGGVQLGPVRQVDRPGIPGGANVDLATGLVASNINSRNAEANASVLRTLNDLTGETLDVLA